MAQFSAKSSSPFKDVSIDDDDAAAQAGADDGGNRSGPAPRAESAKCPQSAPAFPSFRYVTGFASFFARFSRMSNPAQFGWTKFVEPRALSTPVVLAGPGVSRPTTATSPTGTPALAAAMVSPL
jgi:hypothetical protein